MATRDGDSPPPARGRSRSRSPPPRRSPPARREERDDRGPNEGNTNPGNNLYITGLSTRVTEEQLLAHFSKEGKVTECRLVKDPRTHESRGFGFVTMGNVADAEYAVRNLNRSTLEGRAIVVEKAKRKRARTPTPGEYLGVRGARDIAAMGGREGGGGSRDGGDRRDDRYGGRQEEHRSQSRRSPEYAPYRGGGGGGYGRERERSPPRYASPHRGGRRSRSPPDYRRY